jgi:hypothetical protein
LAPRAVVVDELEERASGADGEPAAPSIVLYLDTYLAAE